MIGLEVRMVESDNGADLSLNICILLNKSLGQRKLSGPIQIDEDLR